MSTATSRAHSEMSYDPQSREIMFVLTIITHWQLPDGLTIDRHRDGQVGMVMSLETAITHGKNEHGLPIDEDDFDSVQPPSFSEN